MLRVSSTDGESAEGPRPSGNSFLTFAPRVIFGALVILLLWLLFRKTDWVEVGASIGGVTWSYILVSQCFVWGSHFIRTQRWSYIVRSNGPAPFCHLFSAMMIGFLVNVSFPARLGELVRAYLLSRHASHSMSQSIGSIVLDRLTDLIGLLAILVVVLVGFSGVTSVLIPSSALGNAAPIAITRGVLRPITISTVALILCVTGLIAGLYWQQDVVLKCIRRALSWISHSLAEKVCNLLGSFVSGLHAFRSPVVIFKSVLFSLLTWGSGVFSLAAIFCAFGIDFPWYCPFLVVATIAAFVTVPIAPGMIGQYHLGVMAGLILAVPDIDLNQVKAVAIVTHALNLLPIGLMGIFCLLRESVAIDELWAFVFRKRGTSVDEA